MGNILAAAMPFIGLALAAIGVVLMVIYAPDGARDVVNTAYADFIKAIALTLGPAAAAFIGDLTTIADRPKFGPETPAHVRRNFLVSRWASIVLFGMLGGLGAAWAGQSAMLGYVGAAIGGHLGTKIINVVFQRVIDKHFPAVAASPQHVGEAAPVLPAPDGGAAP